MADIGPGLTTDITDDETSTGYLPVIGEVHYNEECQYARRLARIFTIHLV